MGNVIRPAVGKLINSVLSPLGLEMGRKRPSKYQRNSMIGALSQIKNSCNFTPRTIVDIGAAFGDWSRLCCRIFPDAQYFLFEPLREFAGVLKRFAGEFENVIYFESAAGSHKGNMVINVHEDLVGSSFLKEAGGAFSDGQPREVSVVTLDEALKSSSGPYLIKIDVQGAELDILRGATKILEDTEYIILEVSLFQSMIDVPQLFDALNFMKGKGFVAYDIISFSYRPIDQALSQVDMAFVKENGMFQKEQRYCTPEQRKEQNRRFKERHRKRLTI